nr:hypothetical protein [Bradyrhizobium liaoningense]
MATLNQVASRGIEVGYLWVLEERAIEDRPSPVDHPDEEALRILRKAAKARGERAMLVGEDLAICLLHEMEHFDEVVEIIVDRQRGRLHLMRAGFPSILVDESVLNDPPSTVLSFLFCSDSSICQGGAKDGPVEMDAPAQNPTSAFPTARSSTSTWTPSTRRSMQSRADRLGRAISAARLEDRKSS